MQTTTNEFAVRCRDLRKSYGKGEARVTALRGIDLDVRPGEMMMLVGPSGCGKTTLISVIAGILDADAGHCTVFGHDLQAMQTAERTRHRGRTVGFVFQAFNLLPALSAAENVAVPLLVQGVRRSEALERANALLERVGLGARSRSLPAHLSGGQQQRVAIARAMIHRPRLIVCDEPTSALDALTGAKVMELLREIAVEADRALVVVTHDARIFRFADRVALMDDGHIERVVTPAELAATPHG